MPKYAKPQKVYTFREVCELTLRDSPCLLFWDKEGNRANIQDSHMTREEMLSVPGFADSEWRYIRETHEWIPVFTYAGKVDIFTFVEPTREYHGEPSYALKGFPRS
jgi:hypothetical protein